MMHRLKWVTLGDPWIPTYGYIFDKIILLLSLQLGLTLQMGTRQG